MNAEGARQRAEEIVKDAARRCGRTARHDWSRPCSYCVTDAIADALSAGTSGSRPDRGAHSGGAMDAMASGETPPEQLPQSIRGLVPDALGPKDDDPEMDGTDAAHPAWWRGHEQTSAVWAALITEWLDASRPPDTWGTMHEPWQTIRARIHDLVRGSGTSGSPSASDAPVDAMAEVRRLWEQFKSSLGCDPETGERYDSDGAFLALDTFLREAPSASDAPVDAMAAETAALLPVERERLAAIHARMERAYDLQSRNSWATHYLCDCQDLLNIVDRLRTSGSRSEATPPVDAMAGRSELWDAINRYAVSVGGDPSEHQYGNIPRMQAVVDIERAVSALAEASEPKATPAEVARLHEGLDSAKSALDLLLKTIHEWELSDEPDTFAGMCYHAGVFDAAREALRRLSEAVEADASKSLAAGAPPPPMAPQSAPQSGVADDREGERP